jgi:hypothetical protein
LSKLLPQLFALLILSGCTIVSNLDQITTLQNYSKEKDNQHRVVKSINDHYDALSKAIDQGHMSNYKDEASFVKFFGEPIVKKDLNDGTVRWLYRYAIFRLARNKVYVYFDREAQAIKWERLPCSSFY